MSDRDNLRALLVAVARAWAGSPRWPVEITLRDADGETADFKVRAPAATSQSLVDTNSVAPSMSESEMEVAWVLSEAVDDAGLKATEVAAKLSPRSDAQAAKKRLQRMRSRGLVELAENGGYRLTCAGQDALASSDHVEGDK